MNFKLNSNKTSKKLTTVNIWSCNFYKIPKQEYNKLLISSIRGNYKKEDVSVVNSINKDFKRM